MSVGIITRNQAATLCAVAASNFTTCCTYGLVSLGESFGASDAVVRLAIDAWNAAERIPGWTAERYAEAESLLRTGWTP